MALIDEILAHLHCQVKTRVPRALKSRCSSRGERHFLTDLKLGILQLKSKRHILGAGHKD